MTSFVPALAPGIALLGWTAFALGLLWQSGERYGALSGSPRVWLANAVVLALAPVALWVLFALLWRGREGWLPAVRRRLDAHTGHLDALPLRRLGGWILVAAGAGLFCELMIIRVHSSFFHLFGYYKNVSLLSCFLGLGIGYALGGRGRVATPLVLPGLALQIALLHSLRLFGVGEFLKNPVTEQVTLGLAPLAGAPQALTVYGFLVAIFATNALCFVPLGHLASRLMLRLDPLAAYGWNLLGSVLGVGVFALLSFAWTPPSVWVLVPAAALLPLLWRPASHAIAGSVAIGGLVVLLGISVQPNAVDFYSPYQILSVSRAGGATSVAVNNAYFQRMLDLRDEATAGSRRLRSWAGYYGIPYRLVPEPERVLVVGAGTGNDVAAALRHGAGHVDAVEIDPLIQQIGRAAHPENPYGSPRVNPIVDDARSFFRSTDARYDLIVYGLLDSHTLLASASNVRLDSYVYTVEAFREARARLAEGGVLALSFSVGRSDTGRKIYEMLTQAFDGRPPEAVTSYYDAGITFLAGEDLTLPEGLDVRTSQFAESEVEIDVSTDDWPFLYMARRSYPTTYLLVIGTLLGVSLLLIRQFLPGSGGGFSLPCFFLGAGFMLLETKAITELALVYGSTWVVVSAVITAILLLGYAANRIVASVALPRPGLVYGLLLGSLVVCWQLAGLDLGGLPPLAARLVLTFVMTLPLFFAGMAFSTELRTSAAIPAALSANLIGSMLGGFLEYNSMYFGFEALWWLAMAMYAAAFAARGRV